MTSNVTPIVTEHRTWLSQGDIFERLPVVTVGVRDSALAADWAPGPAMLVSHGCAIDKKHNKTKRSTCEWLSFLPIQDMAKLDAGKAGQLREVGLDRRPPYNVLYLGELPSIGEGYAPLVQVYTLPAVVLATEVRDFTDDETGEGPDRRLVPTVHDTRVASLTADALDAFHWKWTVQWTGASVTAE